MCIRFCALKLQIVYLLLPENPFTLRISFEQWCSSDHFQAIT